MSIWHLNLRHLAAVAQIARLGTINAAARAVNLTQPAITQALARLEAQLGLPLFERRHDGMAPTPAAELLVPRIEAALASLDSPHVTMSRLRALLALADAGSYAGAGGLTGLSLPSLHRAVGDLSLAMRRSLVQRRGKIVVLTEAGMQLARAFRLARIELETGISEIEALKGRETRRIAIGAMPLSRARVLIVCSQVRLVSTALCVRFDIVFQLRLVTTALCVRRSIRRRTGFFPRPRGENERP